MFKIFLYMTCVMMHADNVEKAEMPLPLLSTRDFHLLYNKKQIKSVERIINAYPENKRLAKQIGRARYFSCIAGAILQFIPLICSAVYYRAVREDTGFLDIESEEDPFNKKNKQIAWSIFVILTVATVAIYIKLSNHFERIFIHLEHFTLKQVCMVDFLRGNIMILLIIIPRLIILLSDYVQSFYLIILYFSVLFMQGKKYNIRLWFNSMRNINCAYFLYLRYIINIKL